MDTFTLIRLVGVIVVLGAALVALLLPLALVLAFREYRARATAREARRAERLARAVEREELSATQASCADPPGLLRLPDGSYYGPDGVIYGEIPY